MASVLLCYVLIGHIKTAFKRKLLSVNVIFTGLTYNRIQFIYIQRGKLKLRNYFVSLDLNHKYSNINVSNTNMYTCDESSENKMSRKHKFLSNPMRSTY